VLNLVPATVPLIPFSISGLSTCAYPWETLLGGRLVVLHRFFGTRSLALEGVLSAPRFVRLSVCSFIYLEYLHVRLTVSEYLVVPLQWPIRTPAAVGQEGAGQIVT